MGLLGNKLGPLFVGQALILLVVLGGSSAITFFGLDAFEGSTTPAVAEDEQLVPAQIGDLITVVTTDGNLSFPVVETPTFGVAGNVGEILVEEGDTVEEGQALARLDPTSIAALEKSLAKTAVDLRDAQDDLANATDDVDALALAKAEVALAKAENALTGAIVDHQALIDGADDIIAAIASDSLDYKDTFVRWLGVPESIVNPDLEPSVLLTAWDANLSEIFPGSSLPTDINSIPELDDPNTVWNEVSVATFIAFFPGTLVGECVSEPPAYGTCISAELDAVWAALEEARASQISGTNDTAVASADIMDAQADLDVAIQALADLNAAPDQRDIDLLQADLTIAELAFTAAEDNLATATMTAPIAGIVSVVALEVGDNAAGNNARGITIVDESVVEIAGTVDEIDVLLISEGVRAAVSLSALAGETLVGTVTEIGTPSNNQGVVTFPVSVQVDVPPGLELREGLTATASVVVSQELNVLRVPTAAITGSFVQPMVRVANGGDVQEREVELGSSDDFWVVVTAGLTAGEQVIMPAPSVGTTQFGNFAITPNQAQVFRALQGGGGGRRRQGGGGQGGGGQ
jgi:multidrug efflux pump subunit AcrA (membrane-fusion protein)